MQTPSKIGIREFRAGLAGFLATETPVAITRHGQTVGYFIPAQALPCAADVDALRQAAAELDQQLAAHDVAGEAIAEDFRRARNKTKHTDTPPRRPRHIRPAR